MLEQLEEDGTANSRDEFRRNVLEGQIQYEDEFKRLEQEDNKANFTRSRNEAQRVVRINGTEMNRWRQLPGFYA